MSCVHYKFSSKLDYNTVTFDGLHITLNELKRQIMDVVLSYVFICSLMIVSHVFTEYTDDEAHIPKHSSVIVRRTPLGGVKPAGRTFIVHLSRKHSVNNDRALCIFCSPRVLATFVLRSQPLCVYMMSFGEGFLESPQLKVVSCFSLKNGFLFFGMSRLKF
uniref:DWNN domain-containing protein n=1 Tax=Scophthalmus maximus TaxID=52904 RepID=A0A8D3D254_SCOMX